MCRVNLAKNFFRIIILTSIFKIPIAIRETIIQIIHIISQNKYSNSSQNIQKKILLSIFPLHCIFLKKNIPIYIYKKLKNSARLEEQEEEEEEYRLPNYSTVFLLSETITKPPLFRREGKKPGRWSTRSVGLQGGGGRVRYPCGRRVLGWSRGRGGAAWSGTIGCRVKEREKSCRKRKKG